MTTYEWLAECDGCDWTGAHVLADVAYDQLRDTIKQSMPIPRRAALFR
jgi:hypothetical protein